MHVKIKTLTGNVPKYETSGSSGMDIKASLESEIILAPGERALIPTGLFIELDIGYEAQIRPRSGLAIKSGIGLANCVGTIDSDYRGEIKVPLINWSNESFTVKDGDRIAQMIVSKYEKVIWDVSDTLDETKRSGGGFGHTGVE